MKADEFVTVMEPDEEVPMWGVNIGIPLCECYMLGYFETEEIAQMAAKAVKKLVVEISEMFIEDMAPHRESLQEAADTIAEIKRDLKSSLTITK